MEENEKQLINVLINVLMHTHSLLSWHVQSRCEGGDVISTYEGRMHGFVRWKGRDLVTESVPVLFV